MGISSRNNPLDLQPGRLIFGKDDLIKLLVVYMYFIPSTIVLQEDGIYIHVISYQTLLFTA